MMARAKLKDENFNVIYTNPRIEYEPHHENPHLAIGMIYAESKREGS